jgi:Domain of unknown function (DUF6852)/Domain of unknown function (DUF5606)
MEYNKLVAVTGLSGLFELLSSKSDGAVIRSLDDNTTKFVSTRQHNFSHLESIEVYTVKENVTLAEIFEAMKDSKEKLPDAKADNKILKAYFGKIYPDMDFERVYTSDMKKMIKWFEILKKHKIEIKGAEDIPENAHEHNKPEHTDATHSKEMVPPKVAPRKIESRGVK